MKKIIIAAALSIMLGACKEGLDPQLYGTLSPTTFPSNETEFELYALEVYKPFMSTWGYAEPNTDWTNGFFSPERGHVVFNDLSSDLFVPGTFWGGFWEAHSTDNFASLVNEGRGASHFEKVRFVTRTTKIIGDLEKATVLTDAKKNQLLAEARLSRGWIMWFLLQYYGPVPVIVDPALVGNSEAESNLTRPSRDFFVNQIAEDLRFAADILEVSPGEYGRFNKGLALTVLMRLYMNEKMFEEAEDIGREIQGLGYTLVADYMSLFRSPTERNNETIWAVSCSSVTDGLRNFNALPFYCLPDDYVGTKLVAGGFMVDAVYRVTWDFYDSFDEDDERREGLISSYVNESGNVRDRTNLPGAPVYKYPDEYGPVNAGQDNDLILARYADVMLMLAEAINENSGPTAEAIDLVNEVRNRAGIGDLDGSDTASKDAFNDAILRERGWELYFEGVRKMDLIRHDKWPSALASVPGKNSSAPALLPLPSYAVINANGQLDQNDGYE